jgi:hypothetical protein
MSIPPYIFMAWYLIGYAQGQLYLLLDHLTVYLGVFASSLITESQNSGALFICMFIFSITARQRLSKHVPMATNTHTTIEELLYTSFSVWSVP